MPEYDLRQRTKGFALRVIQLYIMSPNQIASLLDETDQLIAIFTTIVKKKKG